MSDQLAGYRYLFGLHMGICRGPVDELVEIKVGGKTAWSGSVTDNSTVSVEARNLFGGEGGEGGVEGPLTVLMGGPAQVAPDALLTVLKPPMPGFRRMFTVFFDGIVSMMNPYPKPWSFRVRRARVGWDGDPWYPEKAVITLTRSVSSGETVDSEEAGVFDFAEELESSFDEVDGYYIHLNPLGVAVEVTSIDFWYYQNSAKPPLGAAVPPGQFTLVGDKVFLTDGGIFHPATIFGSYAHGYRVNYRVAISTVTPGVGLGDALIQAMNPAHIIYECYTNREWGRGLPASSLDEASFIEAADKLAIERFGLCLPWKRRDSIDAFIQGVLDHIGGVTYPDRATAKIKLKLIRDDYVATALPLYDADTGLIEITAAPVGASTPMINEVTVTYRDPITNEDRTVRANNLASVQAAGGVLNSTTREYRGLPTAALAARIAKRELRAASPSIRKFDLVFDRRGFNLVPGDVIRIQDFARNISPTVVRIVQVDYGSMSDGKIKVTGMRDVFGLPSSGFETIGPPTWTPPRTQPCVGDHAVFELPYRSLYRSLSPAELAFVDNDSAYLGVVCEEGQPLNMNYTIATRSGAPTLDDEPPNDSFICGI